MLCAAVLLSSAFLVNPPTPVSWAVYAERGGTKDTAVLRLHLEAVNDEAVEDSRRPDWKALRERINRGYKDASPRERIRMAMNVLKFSGVDGMRFFDALYVRIGPHLLTEDFILYPGVGGIYRLTDQLTGEYVGVLTLLDGKSRGDIIEELLRTGSTTVLEKHRRELQESNEATETIVEVNGNRRYLAEGSNLEASSDALVSLWPQLSEAAATRLGWLLQLQEAALGRVGDGPGSMIMPPPLEPPFDVAALKLASKAPTVELKIISSARAPRLELPIEDALEPFRTGKHFTLPDMTLTFRKQVKALF